MNLHIKISKNRSNTELHNFKTSSSKEIRLKYTKNIKFDFTFPSTEIGQIIQQYQIPTNHGFYRYLAALVFYYCGFVELNCKTVWHEALKKYAEAGGSSSMISSEINMSNTIEEIAKILKPVTLKLHETNYQTNATPEQIEKLKEEQSSQS